MIQFNLLPDIKIQYIKARRQKRMVLLISTIASIAAVTIFVILIVVVDGLQKKNLSDLNRDISNDSTQLQNTPNLNKILTVQNQLNSLTALHDKAPVTSRVFTYLPEVTPAAATIEKLDADYTQNTLSISGQADTPATVNTYVDTLKHTMYSVSGQSNSKNAFSNVVLSAINATNTTTTYTITLNFDPTIFSEDDTVSLTVPQITSTGSVLDQPLFQNNDTTK